MVMLRSRNGESVDPKGFNGNEGVDPIGFSGKSFKCFHTFTFPESLQNSYLSVYHVTR